MVWSIDKEKCLRCGACVSVCPFIALNMNEHGLKNDKEKCTLCGICQRICPVAAIKVEK